MENFLSDQLWVPLVDVVFVGYYCWMMLIVIAHSTEAMLALNLFLQSHSTYILEKDHM